MDVGLRDKVALVTGGSRGIGLAVVRALVDEGALVVAGAMHGSTALTELAESGRVHVVTVDLTDRDGADQLVSEAVARFGGLDILVNNVGAVRPRLEGFLALTDDDWAWSMGINFLPAVRATRAALPHLVSRAPSTVVTVSSVNAFLPDPGVIDYCAAKAALSNFGKSLSKEFGPRGVRINTISPGPVETDLWLGDHGLAALVAGAGDGDAAAVARRQAAAAPSGRFTHPDEVADLVVFLAGNRAANITGADVTIDGGLITTL